MATVKTPDSTHTSAESSSNFSVGGPAEASSVKLGSEAWTAEVGLSASESARAEKELGRALNPLELAIVTTLWSEREAQKTARAYTRRLSSGGAHVLRVSSHGAGALDLGGGLAAVVSVVSAVHGDVGSAAVSTADEALRNVLAAGAAPLGLLDAVRLGDTDAPATARDLRALGAELGAYVRSADTRVVGGELRFDSRHRAPPIVQSCAVGVVRAESLVPARATGLGNTLVLVDRVDHAEPGAPAAHDKDQHAARLVKAVLAAYRTGSVEGALAVGAGGVAVAAARLAQAGETGAELDLDALAQGQDALAQGQDGSAAGLLTRGGLGQLVLVVRKGRDDALVAQLAERGVSARVVGRVTNTGRLVCKATAPKAATSKAGAADAKQAVIADLPVGLLVQQVPSYERPLAPAAIDARSPEVTLRRNEDAESELVRVLGSCNVGSREWLLRRLEGAARPGAGPAGDATVIALPGDEEGAEPRLLAISVDANHRMLELAPRHGAAMAVAECARNLVCVGAEPVGLAHGLCFGSPDAPSTGHELSEAIDGLNDACVALKLPIVSGHVAHAGVAMVGAPTVAVVGQLRAPGDRLGMGFGRQADMVALLGSSGAGNLSGSELAVSRSGEVRGELAGLDLAAEVKLQRVVLELARDRLLSSAHDVSDGGLGVALAECCIAGRIGCSVELPRGDAPLAALFHEEPSRVVVSFPPEKRAKVQERCTQLGVPFSLLGFVGGDTLEIEDVLDIPVQVLAESHARALERIVQDQA
jgi:phosphoribosylformylglycinamidine synthase subunit PurL